MVTRAFWLVFAIGCMDIESVDTNNDQISSDTTAAKETTTVTSLCGGPYSARGRASGLEVTALGLVNLAPAPDTDIANPDALAVVDLPLGSGGSITDAVFAVEDDPTSSGCGGASDTATATTNQLVLSLPYVNLSATTLRAVASSSASADGTSVSSQGSLVQNLRINGRDYLNISGPQTITILGLLGVPLAEVRVLERIPGNNTYDAASLQVNALHIIVLGGLIDAVISHAETAAEITHCGS